MNKLQVLQRYFPTGTTEGEKHLFDKVFVTPLQLAEILNTQPGSPRLIIGRKGVGKSALLEWLKLEFTKSDVPCILIKPDDIEAASLLSGDDIASLKRKIFDSLVKAVASKLGSELSGLITGKAMTLYEQAVGSGERDASFPRKVIELVSAIARPTTKVDASALISRLTGSTSTSSLSKTIEFQLSTTAASFYIFIDDTDQIASPNDLNHLNRIWAFILAARKLTEECPSLKCLISFRTEVWLRLTKNELGQRDQIDHIRPLVVMLRTSEDHISQIVLKRLRVAATELGEHPLKATDLFFEKQDVKLPTSEERRSWKTFLIKSGRERPRDVVQLIGHLIKQALKRGGDNISDADVEAAMKDYSKERFEDLNIEFGGICSNLSEVMRMFAGKQFEMSFEELRTLLKSVPSIFGVRVYGKTLHLNVDDDALALLAVLHEADFINAKKFDEHMERKFLHISFLDDPHLVQKDRWRELQGMTWEVHPVFRSHLIALAPARLSPPRSRQSGERKNARRDRR